MATLTPAMIKELRERTGIGVGKCKEALEEAQGDIELAIVNLRKAGMASAVKKEGRETKEGVIGFAETSHAVAIVEVNAETDFVAKNERLKEFLHNITEEVVQTNPLSLESFLQQHYSKEPTLTMDQYRATMVQTVGENIQIRRLLVLQKRPDHSLGIYSHLGGKIVTAVEISGSGSEEGLAKDIAMHIAAAAPEYLSPEQVPQEVINNEREIAKGQMPEGKRAEIIEKIIEGKINAYYETATLIRQKYIKDDSMTVGDLVHRHAKESGKPLAMTYFVRWSVGQSVTPA